MVLHDMKFCEVFRKQPEQTEVLMEETRCDETQHESVTRSKMSRRNCKIF